jgi:hypothetical protein
MRHRLERARSLNRTALVVVALLGLAIVLCLVHGSHQEAGDLDMLHGACSPALIVSVFAAGLVFVSTNWWLLTSLAPVPYAVSLHLPDPPPKSPALF